MAHLVGWSRRSTEDLAEIGEFISRDSEAYAASVIRTIIRKTRTLSDLPFAGRIVPEFDDDSIREIFAYTYRIIHHIQRGEIQIAAVIHGKRLLDISLKP